MTISNGCDWWISNHYFCLFYKGFVDSCRRNYDERQAKAQSLVS